MKKMIITILTALLFYTLLPAQEIIEKSFPLKPAQKVELHLKFAQDIQVETWNQNELNVKAEVDINNGKLNHAHTMDIIHESNLLKIMTGLDEEILKNSEESDCQGKHTSHFNFNGKDGYSICSTINYTIYLPANTDLKVETISGNIIVASRQGPIEAKSISGFVDMSSPAAQKADLYLKSISGEVYTDLDIDFTNRQENPIVGYELKGKLNGGGEIVRLESISGDVYLRKGN